MGHFQETWRMFHMSITISPELQASWCSSIMFGCAFRGLWRAANDLMQVSDCDPRPYSEGPATPKHDGKALTSMGPKRPRKHFDTMINPRKDHASHPPSHKTHRKGYLQRLNDPRTQHPRTSLHLERCCQGNISLQSTQNPCKEASSGVLMREKSGP